MDEPAAPAKVDWRIANGVGVFFALVNPVHEPDVKFAREISQRQFPLPLTRPKAVANKLYGVSDMVFCQQISVTGLTLIETFADAAARVQVCQ